MESKEDIADVYDKFAVVHFEEAPGKVIDNWPVGEAVLPDIKGKQILEAGCATGYETFRMVKRGADVVGIDVSEKMIERANNQYGDIATFMQADIRKPIKEFDSGKFDIIVAHHVLILIEDWKPIMEEFYRLLTVNGQLVMSCDHPFKLYRENGTNYYEVERFTKHTTIEKNNEEVTIPFYRRPLMAMLNPLFESGLVLEAMEESIATNDSERLEHFENSIPQFLALRARKVGASQTGESTRPIR